MILLALGKHITETIEHLVHMIPVNRDILGQEYGSAKKATKDAIMTQMSSFSITSCML